MNINWIMKHCLTNPYDRSPQISFKSGKSTSNTNQWSDAFVQVCLIFFTLMKLNTLASTHLDLITHSSSSYIWTCTLVSVAFLLNSLSWTNFGYLIIWNCAVCGIYLSLVIQTWSVCPNGGLQTHSPGNQS